MSKVSNHQELAEALCAALQADADEAAVAAFVDGLYDVDGIEDEELRAIVTTVRDDTKLMFAKGRQRLAGAVVAVSGLEREGSKYITVLAASGGPTLSIAVDDVYESDEALHTRDTISINLVKPIAG